MSLPIPSTGAAIQLDQRQLEAMEAPLIALTNHCDGDLRKLLFAFFSFLHRRTDFYLVPNEADLKEGKVKMGFKEGDAEKLILAAFRQFPLRRMPRHDLGAPSPVARTPPKISASEPKAKSPEKSMIHEKNEKDADGGLMAGVNFNEEGLQIPVGNGGSTKGYKWTQTIDECSVMLGIPKDLHGKNLIVSIQPRSITVKTKTAMDGASEPTTFLHGTLSETIVPDESTWSLEGGVLVLVLYKKSKTFWKTILEGDEMIDTSLVDSRRHIDEYDASTQSQIRKIIYDQSQMRLGLPTSDEQTGAKPTIPELPPGVEYIDQQILDEKTRKIS